MEAYRLVRRPGGVGAGVVHSGGAGQGGGRAEGPAVAEPRSGGSTGDGAHPRAAHGPDARRPDPVQAEVVAHTDGPMLVVGGPGTGKTSTLVEAVAARVAEGVDPERILVLTFGRRGATDLRHRIEARIAGTGHRPADGPAVGGTATRPVRVVREPLVRTFPAYAFGLLRRAAVERGEPSPRLLTGPEQDLIIRELLDVVGEEPGDDPVGWPEDLRPALRTRAFAQQLRDLLMRAAERGVGPVELARLGEKLGRADWPAAARFLREYVAVLALRDVSNRGSIAYDPAELVRAATGMLLDDPELLAAERRRLAHVYVDELADTDPAQLDLLAVLAGGGKSLVAFADPDSSTYAFRGADPAGVGTFPHRFRTASGAPAAQVTLTTSYRAGPELLAATARLARRLRGPAGHRRLHPLPDAPPGAVEVRTFRSATSESAWLAHALREAHLLDGVPWSRMAVLVRSTGRQLPSLRRALHTAGVPTVVHGEDLPLHLQPGVAPLLLLLRCALDPEQLDEEAAVALLHSPLGGADPLAERRLRQGLRALALAAGDRRPSGELIVEALRDPAELATVERRWAAPAQAVARLLDTARQAAAGPGATAEDVLWAVWRESGLAERWAGAITRGRAATGEHETAQRWRAEAADRDLDAVLVLFDAAARFTDRLPGARTEVFLDHVLGQDLPADTLAASADRGEAVRLLTAHAAKGLEWDLVAIAGVQEGVWPDLRLRGSLLGSERLVDVLAGRADGAGLRASLVGQTSALLDEERRLFHVAVSRARRRLLVTAVASAAVGGDDHEEQPSRFLHELAAAGPPAVGGSGAPPAGPHPTPMPDGPVPVVDDPPDGAPVVLPVTLPPRGLTLSALVAELRTAVTDPAVPVTRRRAAAAELARLAAAGVPGAHPDDWWGLRGLSDDRPLVDEGEPVRVTPSAMESALRCSLRWLLERHGGSGPASAAQGVGNLVHAAAMLAEDASADRTALLDYVAARFDAIELAARWMVGPERQRAEAMVDKLLRWLAGNPRRLLAIEHEFAVRLDDPARPIELTGRVDRLEVDEDGRLVVIDLKTGKSTAVTEREVAEHPQLGAYQAAVEAGAFAEFGEESGGAALVQLGTGAKEAKEQAQAAAGEGPEAGWATALVRRTADTMAAATFAAVANAKCRVCPVRTSCPVSGQGRQVVEPPAESP
ncbi:MULTISPECIES: ATP-dependent DNA helicase [Micromonospora]|uniref:DNA 3'-5' helicase n=1 Tax=Micromonospora solifontis TaxID=2487138 RepID=A0ABX9WJ79_9ACTN|nr:MULTISPECIES: ATP-dependent DNA helicase [Micromonospora]NES15355.1 ATP-dependent helicase [Micromonospora sp. PPF5-17B]NES36146.1 ATP-dependent helicase [Micromonospora solifontis]NES56703.1 ATP-dependent helicase [Micromonospora sp. PPF5-6]RNL99899.1 ATP-dependent helicase [Micromonospora solifontis]